jgi:DNA processing protein
LSTPESPALDLLLRLSTIEGFTIRQLRRLQAGSPLRLAGPPDVLPSTTLLEKGYDAVVSRVAGEQVDRIRNDCAKAGIQIIPAGSPEYPTRLLEIADAPLVLFRLGLSVDTDGGAAVVGSRAPTAPGKAFAKELSADLSADGVVIVSGLARGVDTAAHEGALEGGGPTVAVLGCGVDVVYPPESGRLRERIRERGAIISEYAPGSAPVAWRFPARNRIVSGMTRATIVAEASLRSGALITARLALDQGREVMAVPGSPFFPHTAGSNRLLRDGAAPVTCAGDVLLALGRPPGPDPSTPEGKVVRYLRKARHVEEIARGLRLPACDLLPLLLRMEQTNLIRKTAGNYYIRMTV